MAKNRQELELLSCVVGLIVGVALGALSMGIARPPLMATPAAHASSAAAHARAVRTQQDSMLGL